MIVTDDHILNLITHLPKSLPEAFEQALERIPDHQYEGKIMKLVMSAVTPFHLDQIRVALCVEIGELVWHTGKIPKDGMQLLSLSGGNLLDLDEEDGKVRFIHHSVVQHLLHPATRQSTTPYHFTAEDAENYTGATCVTYLQLPVLDSRMTVTRNIQSTKILDNVVDTTQRSLSVASRLIEHIKSREHRRRRQSQINIGQLVAQIQAAQAQQDLDPRCLAEYAAKNWMFHTRFFDQENQDCKMSWRIWWRLLSGAVASIDRPCPDLDGEPFPVLIWAIEHSHGSLFRFVLSESSQPSDRLLELINALELRKSIRGQWLGDIMAQFVSSSLHSIEGIVNSMKILLDLEANPCVPHHIFNSEPLKMLASRICGYSLSSGDEQALISVVFGHPTVLRYLDDRALLDILQQFSHEGKDEAVNVILTLHPHLDFRVKHIRAKRRFKSDIEDIEKAPDNGDWDCMENYGEYQVKYPTSSENSLLWKAIQTESDARVCHLLKLGANPNSGPFKMQQITNTPSQPEYCFPVEAATLLRRTRVCLELLRSGAVVDRVGRGRPLLQMARETRNSILSAKLVEDPYSYHSFVYGQKGTALLTACEMRSSSGSDEPWGFPRPLHNFDDKWDWMLELDKIIYRLALDESDRYVNSQDGDGKTALHHLAEAKNTPAYRLHTLVNVLLSRGANPNLHDSHGRTPIQIAELYGTEFPPM